MGHNYLELVTSQRQSETHAKGDGSTKRAIRRQGLEEHFTSDSSKRGDSSSPSLCLMSVIAMLLLVLAAAVKEDL